MMRRGKRVGNYYAEMEFKVRDLESKVAKLQADRAKLVELVRGAWFDGYNEGAFQENGQDQWNASNSKRRLDEITGGDAEGGN